MQLIINPTKLLYIDENSNALHLGNFPETGLNISFSDSKLNKFFEMFINPVEYDYALTKLCEMASCSLEEAKTSLEFLIQTKILVNIQEINQMVSDETYNRQHLYFYMLSNNYNLEKFNSIKNKNILILGIGGIGSVVAEILVRSGFCNLTILDSDKVEKSNLIRQIAYLSSDVGKSKVDCLENKLKQINGSIVVNKINTFIEDTTNVDNIINKADFVISTLDKPFRVIRRKINEVCVKYQKPVIFSGFAEHVGMVGPFVVPNKTACLHCLDKKHIDKPINTIKLAPSYGPLCSIIGNFVADEVINYFVQFKNHNLQGKTLMINLYNNKSTIKKWKRNKKCTICGGR